MNIDENEYLDRYFLSKDALAQQAEVSLSFIEEAIAFEAIPGPSYKVENIISCSSFLFNKSETTISVTEYFHKSTLDWIKRVKNYLNEDSDIANVSRKIQDDFKSRYIGYLEKISFFSKEEITGMYENIKKHLKKGTYGVCVINPDGPESIAAKQLAAHNLRVFTDNGQKIFSAKAKKISITF